MFPKSRAPRAVFSPSCASRRPAACVSEQAPADTSDAAATPAAAGEVNLRTTREPGLSQPLRDAFTARSGIEFNTVCLKDGLRERLSAECANSQADVLMTVDTGNLLDVVEAGHTQVLDSGVLEAAIPAHLRGADGQWFTLSLRDRVLYAHRDLDLDAFAYEDLADPQWKGRVCIRSGQHPYNTSLFAAMIAHHDAAYTEKWLRGVKDNLARKAAGGDRDVARALLPGSLHHGIPTDPHT